MDVKLNKIYKSADGEFFEVVEKNGQLTLSNPSYPFVFLPSVLEPLEEVGDYEQFKHLIKKVDSRFFEGDTLSVKVTENGLVPDQESKAK